MSLSLNMTVGDDNALIWFVQIELEGSTLRYATRTMTLDNTWSGGKLGFNSLNGLTQSCNFTDGGGVMDLSPLNFETKRLSSLYIDDVFPSTSMPYLTGRRVSLGFAWSTATDDADITWIWEGYVANYSADTSTLFFDVFEFSDIESEYNILPFYKVQKTFNDGISYFTKVDEDVIGVSIPIIYGDFSGNTLSGYYQSYLAPAVMVDNTLLKYKFSSHLVFETVDGGSPAEEDDIFVFDSGIDNYIRFVPDNGSTVNEHGGVIRQFFNSSKAEGESAVGNTVIFFSSPGRSSDVVDIENILDYVSGNEYSLADTKQIGLKPNKSMSNNYVFTNAAADIQFNITAKCASTGQVTLYYYDPNAGNYSTGQAESLSGDVYTGVVKNFGGDPAFTPQGLFNYEWVIKNTSGGGTPIEVNNAILVISNILLFRYPRVTVPITIPMKFPKVDVKINIKTKI